MNNERKIIDSVEALESALASLKDAEKKFSTYTQEQVDKIFLAAASAATHQGNRGKETDAECENRKGLLFHGRVLLDL
ncbi:MAG: hypothetical protein EGR44_00555 [Ruminococcaceae bacterium]|nr:hypothetical protein [Oscillospiraceae bacterium]